MDWIWEHAVLLAVLVAIVAVLAAIAYLALQIWDTWRSVKAANRIVGPAAEALSRDVARVSAAAERVSSRPAEIQAAVAQLQHRAQALGVLATHASLARRVLMSPLRYIGR